MPVARRDVNSDICEDYTLPDYYPEIRKVLSTRASLLSPVKFVSGGKVDVNGIVDYTLVYVSAEGKLCSAPLSAEYSFALPLENMSDFEISEGLDMLAHTVCESTNVRVSAPRRLQLRSHLRTAVGVWGKRLCAEKISGAREESEIERLRARSQNVELLCENSDVISLEDEFDLPSESEIAVADGTVLIKNIRPSGEEVNIWGEVVVRALVIRNGESAGEYVIRRLPFEAHIELDGVELSEGETVRANGFVTDLTLNSEEGRTHVSVDLILEVCAAANREFEYTKDAYSISQASDCEFMTLSIPVVVANSNVSMSQNDRVLLADIGYPEGARPIDISASASVDSVLFEDDKCVLHGTCKYSVISQREEEYLCNEFSLPLRYDLELAGDSGSVDFDAIATVVDTRVRTDSESLCIDCELLLSYSIFGERRIDMLDRIEFGENVERRCGEVIICYPQIDDTIWSVAKRYSVVQDEIIGDPKTDNFLLIET
jgi:hypothetical protein